MEIIERQKNNYLLSTDKSKIDPAAVHKVLSQSYWSEGIPLEVVKRSIDNSLCFAIYSDKKLVAFARVISDFATFAYLADVFVVNEYRGRGLSKWLLQNIIDYPELQGLRRFTLATRDAHGLYSQFGFKPFARPDRWMEIHHAEIYKSKP